MSFTTILQSQARFNNRHHGHILVAFHERFIRQFVNHLVCTRIHLLRKVTQPVRRYIYLTHHARQLHHTHHISNSHHRHNMAALEDRFKNVNCRSCDNDHLRSTPFPQRNLLPRQRYSQCREHVMWLARLSNSEHCGNASVLVRNLSCGCVCGFFEKCG